MIDEGEDSYRDGMERERTIPDFIWDIPLRELDIRCDDIDQKIQDMFKEEPKDVSR